MIRKAQMQDAPVLAALAVLLWPQHTYEEMQEDVSVQLEEEDSAFYLAYDGENALGFAHCQLRYDYVEGTDGSPVGYLEGIYVAEECRKKGIAKQLLAACEAWAKSRGCREFASDCELENAQSLQFHLRVGFEEANRIICFVKKI